MKFPTIEFCGRMCECLCAGSNWKFFLHHIFLFPRITTQPQSEKTFFSSIHWRNLCYPGDVVWLFLFVAMCVILFYVRLGPSPTSIFLLHVLRMYDTLQNYLHNASFIHIISPVPHDTTENSIIFSHSRCEGMKKEFSNLYPKGFEGNFHVQGTEF